MRTVKSGDFVKVHYTGKFESGEIFDSSNGCKPLEVQVGNNEVIPGFESALLEMGINDKKTFTIGASDAYGERDDAMQRSFQRTDFPEDFQPNVGDVIVLESEQQGAVSGDGHEHRHGKRNARPEPSPRGQRPHFRRGSRGNQRSADGFALRLRLFVLLIRSRGNPEAGKAGRPMHGGRVAGHGNDRKYREHHLPD